MAIHYSEGANTTEKMSGAVLKFDPRWGKQGTSSVYSMLELSNREAVVPINA
jgi:hypothetical protein